MSQQHGIRSDSTSITNGRSPRTGLNDELLEMLGSDAFIAFVEGFGGRRLYIPLRIDDDHLIAQAIGVELATLLSKRFSADILRIPLAREFRVMRYRSLGMEIGAIASKLCMTESGVDKIIQRFRNRGDAPSR